MLNNDFKFDEKTRNEINVRTVMVLFKILYKEKDITKKQYDELINVLKRRLNIN